MQPGMLRNRCAASTAFESLPDLLVEVETYRIAQRLDGGDQSADGDAAGQRVGHRKGDAEVHQGERHGLEHGLSPCAVENRSRDVESLGEIIQ